MIEQPGLRERKKQQTRETIARAAHELFARQGYGATTLQEIADAADVSTRTIFAYFPSKEDILFSDFPVTRAALAQALADRPEGEEALETMRTFILSTVGQKRSDLDEDLDRCIHGDETLRTHLRARIADLQEVITPEIAKDLGLPATDIEPQIVGAALTAAFTVLSDQRGNEHKEPKTLDAVAAAIDPVFAFLRGGLAALKEPGPDF